ncbi:MAG: Uma2 family endonuclease [Cyanosarcina radialis HA8281-LM2]|jgi:Uma2 family endonuclease|nr:Uma2 family endonuclease [Cyanosarcina radialis HA8281-LM2]
MAAVTATPLSLNEFICLPETKPASEYINGQIVQKPMPKGRHSRLPGKLCGAVNQKQQPILFQGSDSLPVLPEIELALTVDRVFGG